MALNHQAEQLLRRLEVAELVASSFVLAEEGEWERFTARYADPMVLDYSPAVTDGPQSMSRGAFVSLFRGIMESFDTTHHQVTNALVDLDGEHAICRSQMRAAHRIGDAIWTAIGRYTHELMSTPDGGWVIAKQKSIVLGSEGDAGVLNLMTERAKGRLPELPIRTTSI